jgi:hypothetical protein
MITLESLKERGWDKPFAPLISLDVDALVANMIPSTLEQAYRSLGLQQLDQFVLDQVQENKWFGTREPYRQIGASTWMCTRAALEILAGHNVCLQAQDQQSTIRLFDLTCQTIKQLHPKATGKRNSHRCHFDDPKGAYLWWEERPIKTGDTHDADQTTKLRGVRIFNDEDWKERTIRLSQGPCAMTQEIRLEGGRYYGYDEDGERLLELTANGAATMAREPRPKPIRTVGFFVTTDSVPVKPDPEDLVSNIFGSPEPPEIKARIVPHQPFSRILDMGGANATRGYSTSPWAGVRPAKGRKKNA